MVFLKMNLRVRNMWNTSKKKLKNIILEKVFFVGLQCIGKKLLAQMSVVT